MKKNKSFNSLCVHELAEKRTTKPHQLPIYATSSFEFTDINQGIDIFTGKAKGHVYGRYGNPTIEAVAEKIALLETHGTNLTAKGVMVSSGMAAISTLVMGCLKSGDKLLTQGNLYGGTTELFLKIFEPLGIEIILMDLGKTDLVEEKLKNDPAIKLLYCETPANPTMACVDLATLASISKKYNVKTAIDNTFCTPYLQQPLKLGIDFVIHSTTKYLNGHGNNIAGVIVGTDMEMMEIKIWGAMKLLGTNCNPFDAWLTNNGIKTLALRMDRHSSNALTLAQRLESHPEVAKVNYPGLPSHSSHILASKQMSQFGGMLSFELKGGLEAGIALMNRVKFCTLAPTLGDVDTLILHPASSSHVNVDKEIRERNGITDGLIRLSVGIEAVEDIWGDLF